MSKTQFAAIYGSEYDGNEVGNIRTIDSAGYFWHVTSQLSERCKYHMFLWY